MSAKEEPIFLSLRFYDYEIDGFYPPKIYDKDDFTYFKVKLQGKFASLVKRFSLMNKFDGNDLTFYSNGKFLNPSQTVAELGLKDQDVILVKRVVAVNLQFVQNVEALTKSQFVNVENIMVKIEEDATIHDIYNVFLTHLHISETDAQLAGLNQKYVEFYKYDFTNEISRIRRIYNLNRSLRKLKLAPGCAIIIQADEKQFSYLRKNSQLAFAGTSGTTKEHIAELKDAQLQITQLKSVIEASSQQPELNAELKRSQAQIVKLQATIEDLGRAKSLLVQTNTTASLEKNENFEKLLDKKLTLINSLQNEKKKFSDEVTLLKDHLDLAKKEYGKVKQENTTLKTEIGKTKSEFEKELQGIKKNSADIESKLMEMKLNSNDKTIKIKNLEEKLNSLEVEHKEFVKRNYKEIQDFMRKIVGKGNQLIIQFEKSLESDIHDNTKLFSEIHLDPIDFLYLNFITTSAKIPSTFLKVAAIESSHRPVPALQYLKNDEILLKIFNCLYTHNKELTLDEIVKFTGLTAHQVGLKLASYTHSAKSLSNSLYYILEKNWNAQHKTNTYRYSQINDNEIIYNLPDSETEATIPELKNDSLLQTFQDVAKIGEFMSKLEFIQTNIEEVTMPQLSNVSKNLVNVLQVLENFKSQETKTKQEKEDMIGEFKQEMEVVAQKISFVSRYQEKLDSMSNEIEKLRQDKLKFENDNSLFKRFENFLSPDKNQLAIASTNNEDRIIKEPTIGSKRLFVDTESAEESPQKSAEENLRQTKSPRKENSPDPEKDVALSKRRKLSVQNKENQTITNITNGVTTTEISTNDATTTEATTTHTSDEAYLNIKIEQSDRSPIFFKIKKHTKLKRILKTYSQRAFNSPDNTYSQEQLAKVKFSVAGISITDYNQRLQDLGLKDYSIITATI